MFPMARSPTAEELQSLAQWPSVDLTLTEARPNPGGEARCEVFRCVE